MLCEGVAAPFFHKAQDSAIPAVGHAAIAMAAGCVARRQTANGPVVKRAGREESGGSLLIGERPSWNPVPWPGDAETDGQAVWAARSQV